MPNAEKVTLDDFVFSSIALRKKDISFLSAGGMSGPGTLLARKSFNP